MYVKFDFGDGYTRLVECDTLHNNGMPDGSGARLMLCKNGKEVESPMFGEDKVDIFVMSDIGKTIDHIRFSP